VLTTASTAGEGANATLDRFSARKYFVDNRPSDAACGGASRLSVASVASAVGSIGGRFSRRLDRLGEGRFAALVSAPGLLLVALVVIPPIIAVFVMSTFRIELEKTDTWTFVFLRNYLVRLPIDTDVTDAIPRTIWFAISTTLLTVPLALITALIINRRFKGASWMFVITMLPWAVAPVVTGVFWKFMFQSRYGLATGIMYWLHLTHQPINWLADTDTAVRIAVTATSWRSVPLLTVLILAALRTIPSALYRAAEMDGASAWQRFRHITVPGIRNTLLVVGILQVIISLQVFDVLFTLTGGGPGRQTYVLVYTIFQNAFINLSFGYASALTVFLFGLILAFSAVLVYLRIRGRKTTSEVEETSLVAAGYGSTIRGPGAAALETRTGSKEAADTTTFPPLDWHRRRLRVPTWLSRGVVVAIGIGLTVFYAAPIAWILISSTQPEGAITSEPPQLSTNLDLSGFTFLLGDPRWIQSAGVSLETAILTMTLTIVLAAMAAYPLARYRLPGQGAILAVLIFTQMVPAIVIAIPVLIVFQNLNLKDTVAALVIVDTAFQLPLIVWLLRNVFEEVPVSLEKAARIDGCTRLGTLFRITMPTAAPGIAAAAILLLIGTWNEFLFAVILGDNNAVTLTRRISFTESFHRTVSGAGINADPPAHVLATAGVIAVLPCLLLVLLFHRRIISGLTEGFVKA
jgi:ABC-type sugar transport system permease subunit